MNAPRAFLAGVIAGVAMSILMGIGGLLAIPLHAEMMLGTLLGLPPGLPAWMLGFVFHLVISGCIALIYAAAFDYLTSGPGWGMGAAFSLLHVVLAGLATGVLGILHPLVPAVMDEPGLFAINLGASTAVLFILIHVVYGTLVGGLYAALTKAAKPRRILATSLFFAEELE